MTITEFESRFEYAREHYSKDSDMTRCLNDLMNAFDGEVELIRHYKRWDGTETALIGLEDGKVQLDSNHSAGVTKSRVYHVMSIKMTSIGNS